MTDFFFVGGPMNASSIGGVAWANPTKVYNKPIDGSSGNQSFFSTSLANRAKPAIDVLMEMGGVVPSEIASVGIGGFSAFHGLANAMLMENSSRKRIDMVYLADACFSGTAPKEPKMGFFNFATEAFKKTKLMIATTSGEHGKPVTYTLDGKTTTHGSGHDCVRQLYEACQSAVPVKARVPELPAGIPEPVSAVQAGNFIWLDYGTKITHAEHATKIMAPMLSHYGVGWMASKKMPGEVIDESTLQWIAGAAGLAAGYVMAKFITKAKIR